MQRYLDAIAARRPRAACRLLSPRGYANADVRHLSDCVKDYRQTPKELGRVPIIAVHLHGLRDASVIVGDAAYSDSGNDAVTVRFYRSRGWLIDAG